MSYKKRGLGKQLHSLLSSAQTLAEQPVMQEAPMADFSPAPVSDTGSGFLMLPIEMIVRSPYQPRQHFEEEPLKELAESIRAQGLIQPIVVRALGVGRYELLAGERRWRAAQMAGLTSIPAMVREADDQTAAAVALLENIQRENLNPLEEAHAFQRLIGEFGLTHQSLAESLGKSRSAISNALRLLGLTPAVQTLLSRGELDMGHVRALLTLLPEQQLEAAQLAVRHGWSVRMLEQWVKKSRQGKAHAVPPSKDPDIRRLEQSLSEKLSARVTLLHRQTGAGRLIIDYGNLESLDGILERMQGTSYS